MEVKEFIEICKKEIVRDFNSEEHSVDISIEDVFVVWSCKILQNKKAVLGIGISGINYYYEFTEDGDNKRIYMDKYVKYSKQTIIFK